MLMVQSDTGVVCPLTVRVEIVLMVQSDTGVFCPLIVRAGIVLMVQFLWLPAFSHNYHMEHVYIDDNLVSMVLT